MNNRWKNFLNSFHRIFFLEIQMSIVLMLVVWTGVDLLEMMLLYFNKHIQNMEYSPLQILSSTSLSVIYLRCLVEGGLKACGGPTSIMQVLATLWADCQAKWQDCQGSAEGRPTSSDTATIFNQCWKAILIWWPGGYWPQGKPLRRETGPDPFFERECLDGQL